MSAEVCPRFELTGVCEEWQASMSHWKEMFKKFSISKPSFLCFCFSPFSLFSLGTFSQVIELLFRILSLCLSVCLYLSLSLSSLSFSLRLSLSLSFTHHLFLTSLSLSLIHCLFPLSLLSSPYLSLFSYHFLSLNHTFFLSHPQGRIVFVF
jgi:hypothetical protein